MKLLSNWFLMNANYELILQIIEWVLNKFCESTASVRRACDEIAVSFQISFPCSFPPLPRPDMLTVSACVLTKRIEQVNGLWWWKLKCSTAAWRMHAVKNTKCGNLVIWEIRMKKHFHDKTELHLKWLSAAHTLGTPWRLLLLAINFLCFCAFLFQHESI